MVTESGGSLPIESRKMMKRRSRWIQTSPRLRNEAFQIGPRSDGIVSSVQDGIPDNKGANEERVVPITIETVTGNHVSLDIGGGLFAFYAHLQPGKNPRESGRSRESRQCPRPAWQLGQLEPSALALSPVRPQLPTRLARRAVCVRAIPCHRASRRKRIQRRRTRWLDTPEVRGGEMPAENEVVSFSPHP